MDLWFLFIGFFGAPLVLTFDGGGHIEFWSGYAISQSLLLRVTLPQTSSSSNLLDMVSISSLMVTSASHNPWSEKLSLFQNIWIESNGMMPTTYLDSSRAQGKSCVVLMTQLINEELSKQSSTRQNAPSLVARLMGIENEIAQIARAKVSQDP